MLPLVFGQRAVERGLHRGGQVQAELYITRCTAACSAVLPLLPSLPLTISQRPGPLACARLSLVRRRDACHSTPCMHACSQGVCLQWKRAGPYFVHKRGMR